MTIEELIKELKKLPFDAKVVYSDSEIKDNWLNISKIEYYEKSNFIMPENTVLIK